MATVMRSWRAIAAIMVVSWPGWRNCPFIVREMTGHEAVQAMKDSNKQRDQTLQRTGRPVGAGSGGTSSTRAGG